MTLATAILFFGICFASVDPGGVGPFLPQSDSAGSAPRGAQPTPSHQTAPESTTPSCGKPPSETPDKKSKVSAKKTSHTQKVAPAGTPTRDAVPTNGSSAGSIPEAAPQPVNAQATSTPEAPKNCPPAKKKIVPEGGITEQSIQLAGGSSSDATKKRDANRLLAETEDNLKKLDGQKLDGRRLSSAEQSSVSQIRQFVEQSKTAADEGELERAYTLAWKAQVLSDDLVNPKK